MILQRTTSETTLMSNATATKAIFYTTLQDLSTAMINAMTVWQLRATAMTAISSPEMDVMKIVIPRMASIVIQPITHRVLVNQFVC